MEYIHIPKFAEQPISSRVYIYASTNQICFQARVPHEVSKKQEASLPFFRRECLVCIDYSQMPAIILLNLQSLAVPIKEHYLFSHAFGKAVDVFCNNGVIHQENPHLSWDESAQRETTSYSFFSQAAGRERIALITAGSNLALRL